ncbi:putative ribonuclease H-like domain-containing protein [Tanacetum coccineum]
MTYTSSGSSSSSSSYSELVTSIPDVTTSEARTSVSKPKSVGELLIEDWISDNKDKNETEFMSKQRKPSFFKIEFVKSNEHVKTHRESVKKVDKQAKYPRKNSQSPRGNQRNWNNLITQKLGSNFEFKNKACYVYGSFDHLIKDCDFYEKKMIEKPVWNNARRVNHQNSQRMSHPHPKGNFVPKAFLMKFGLKTLNTARQDFSKAAVSVNTARPINTAFPRPTINCARPTSNVFNRTHSHVKRTFNKFTTEKNSNFNEKVNTVKGNVTTVGPKAVGNPQQELKDKEVIDSGYSRHMTGNRSYLTDYEEIDGGFVAFGGSTKGGKITGKGKIRTGKLDIEDVYFVKELKFNLFSVSQICDKKNRVLFTDTECVVLSPDVKLTDESHVLLKVPRKDNMCSRKPALSFIRPFGCPITILNTIDHLSKFDEKDDEGLCVGYSTNSKAFRVFNSKTRIVEENVHVKFNEDTPNITGSGHKCLFDIDALTKSMNYEPVVAGNQSNGNAGTKACNGAGERKRSMQNIQRMNSPINAAGIEDNAIDENIVIRCADDPNMPNLEEIVYSDEGVGAEADMTNLDTNFPISPISTTRIHKDHPIEQIIGDIHSAPQTKRLTKSLTNHEPKKVIQALTDPSWIEAMQDKLLQFKLQKVYRNKKDERGIVVRNKARLVALGYTQEDGIDYDEVFAPVARIEAIRLFLAYASFKDFVVYQMMQRVHFCMAKLKRKFMSANLQDDIIFGSTKKVLCTEFEKLIHKKFQISSMEELTFFLRLQVTQKDDGIFISQDKYVDVILKKFGFSTMKTAITPMETSKPLLKDAKAEDVDVYLYRSMIGSLMYLTAFRPDIMFAVCACARFQVTPKVSHLHVVKRIFRYLKGQPKLGLWYPKDSPFNLEAYTDSDYASESLDRKSIIGGCQFLRSRFISWQCKKQTVVANSTTEAEYVATSICCGQVVVPSANDPPLSRVNTLGSGEDSMKLNELMELCTKLSEWILALG